MSTLSHPRNPWLAAAMAGVLPGFGQLYNGQVNRAIWLFILFAFLSIPGIALIALYLPAGWMMPTLIIGLSATLSLWIFGIIDAYRTARKSAHYKRHSWQVSGCYLLVFIAFNLFFFPAMIGYVREHQVSTFSIPSSSMEPSVLAGDYIFADKRYNCPECKQKVKRGDIAIFVYPNDRTTYYIKRIIGLPGDHLLLAGNDISVNGVRLKQSQNKDGNPDLLQESIDGRYWTVQHDAEEKPAPAQELTVPAGSVYVLGDNRDATKDSRHYGAVPLQDVVGKAHQVWFSKQGANLRWERFGHLLE